MVTDADGTTWGRLMSLTGLAILAGMFRDAATSCAPGHAGVIPLTSAALTSGVSSAGTPSPSGFGKSCSDPSRSKGGWARA